MTAGKPHIQPLRARAAPLATRLRGRDAHLLRQLRSVAQPELAIDARQVGLNRGLAHEQGARHLAVAAAGRHKRGNLLLGGREGAAAAAANALQQIRGDRVPALALRCA